MLPHYKGLIQSVLPEDGNYRRRMGNISLHCLLLNDDCAEDSNYSEVGLWSYISLDRFTTIEFINSNKRRYALLDN